MFLVLWPLGDVTAKLSTAEQIIIFIHIVYISFMKTCDYKVPIEQKVVRKQV